MAIKARAQQTLTKIFDGSGIFSIILTNENTSIPISDQGIALNYSATPTDVYVYSGTSLLTPVSSNPGPGQYTLTASGENITAGLVSTRADHAAIGPATDYVTGKQSYSITVQASGQDFLGNPFSSQKKQVIIPLKKGDDATSYWVTSSSSVITKDTKNVITPSSTTVSALYQTGMADPVSYKGIFKVYLKTGTDFSTTPDYTSQNPESSHTVSPSTSVNDIKVELYDVTGNNILDVQTIPVISQANGVISTSIVYTVTSTAVQPDDSAAWSNTIPSVGKGQYLWTRTTFYYTDGSNAVGYSMGASGKDGSSAPLLTLSADSQIVTFDSDGVTPLPSSQTVTLVANLQNVTGTATFTATPYAGTTAGSPITLGGSGNSRTLTVSQFGTTYDSIVVKATLGALSDTETIHKLSKGAEGADGKNGSDGAQGPKGADGRTSYVHVAYANSADGKTDFSTTVSTGKTYVGVFTDFTSTDSTNPADYTWSLIKGSDGKDGSDGIQGPKGADGISTYVHFAYATSADGKTGFSTTDTTGKSYVGTLTDTTVADSTDPTKYTWSLMKGADGANGADGKNSFSGWLTNESITLQADSSGNVPSYTTATGTFLVYNGTTQVTGLTVSQANANGITVSISGMNYSVTGMSKDNGYVDLSVTTSGVTIIKRLTVAKSKAGATGANGTSVVNSTTPPSNPAEGQWWNDLSVTPNIVKVYQSGSWVPYRIDAINLVSGSVKTSNLAADVLTASNVVYKNSDGTTTNLQTFDFNGFSVSIQKAQTAADNANNSINNLAVGGRNYVLNSSGLNANANAQPTVIGAISSNARSTLSYGSDGITMTNRSGNTGSEWYYQIAQSWQDITQTPLSDGNYMISVDVMGTASQAILRYGQKSSKSSDLMQAFIINNTTWTRISMPIIFAPNTTTFYIRINGGANGTISGANIFTGTETIKFRNVKIETGNKATDWTPAPEDVQSGIDTAQAGVNTLSQVNLINNSDFAPDLGGWTQNNNGANGNYTTGDYDYAGGVYVLESTTTGMARTNSAPIPINTLSTVSFSFNFYIFTLPSGGSVYSQLTYLDANYNEINGSGYPGGINLASGNATGKWINRTVNNLSFTPPTNAKYLVFSFDVRGKGTKAGFNRPILVKGATVGNYVKGDYGMSTATVLKLTADNYTIGIDANGNLVSGLTGNAQSVTLKGNAIHLDAQTVIADNFTTRLLSAENATIGKVLTIGQGGTLTTHYVTTETYGMNNSTVFDSVGDFALNQNTFGIKGTLTNQRGPSNHDSNEYVMIGYNNSAYYINSADAQISISPTSLSLALTNIMGTGVRSSLQNVKKAAGVSAQLTPTMLQFISISNSDTGDDLDIKTTDVTARELYTSGNLQSTGTANLPRATNIATSYARPNYASGFHDHDQEGSGAGLVYIVRSGSMVTIFGAAANYSAFDTQDNDKLMFTIPDGYRPLRELNVLQQGSQSNRFLMRMTTDGNVYMRRYLPGNSTNYTTVGANAWLNVNVTYVANIPYQDTAINS